MDEEELVRLLLGRYTLKECAALLEVTYSTLCARARRPEFLDRLRELSKETWAETDRELRLIHGNVTERLVLLSERALTELEALMDDEGTDDRLRAKIAMDFLDRTAETSKSTKSLVKNTHEFINPLQLKHAAAAAREMDDSVTAPTLEADYGN